MIYKYDIYLGYWKTGRINAASVEAAAALIKNIYKIEGRDTTIVLYKDCEEFDDISGIKT